MAEYTEMPDNDAELQDWIDNGEWLYHPDCKECSNCGGSGYLNHFMSAMGQECNSCGGLGFDYKPKCK